MTRAWAGIPRSVLTYILAPLILAMVPAVLWLSVPAAGAKGQIPLWLTVSNPVVFEMDPLYLVSLVLIGVLAVAMITFEASRAPFSLHLAHWIFVYIFFFNAPLVQYKIGTFPWDKLTSLDTGTLLYANLAILLWSVVWIVSRLTQLPVLIRGVPLGPRVSNQGVWISLVLSFVVTAYLVWKLGPLALLSRAGYTEAIGDAFGSSSSRLILDKLLRGIPVAAAAGALWWLWRGRFRLSVRFGIAAGALALLLIADFPLGSARYWVGAIYVGLLLILTGRYLRTGWPFVFTLAGGLLLVFPVLSALRYATSAQNALPYLKSFNFLGPSLATGDFDAYSMVAYTVQYIQQGPGITLGRQLLGVLFFFIPRSVWPDKPVGSGYTVAQSGGLAFNNVSSSPVAEGLINFGWVGVVLFAIVLSWLFGFIDASYRQADRKGYVSLLVLLYPFWVGFAFFLMRGDMLSATAFITGFSVAFIPLILVLPRIKF